MLIKTIAVIVTYNPTPSSLIQLLATLATQTLRIIIVDNNSANLEAWQEKVSTNEKVTLLVLDKNYGIAYAQNKGIQQAISTPQSKYIVFFDQDSMVTINFIRSLQKGYEALSAKNPPIAAVGPICIDKRYNFYYPLIRFNRWGFRRKILTENKLQPCRVSTIISSGMLVHKAILQDIGLMNESFFIDHVDTEWCLRAVSKGYHIYAIPAAKMQHAIGDEFIKVGKWRLSVHSPTRRYYQVRNTFYMFKLGYIPKLIAVREMVFSIIHQCLLIILYRKKREYWRVLWKAIKDGMSTNFIRKGDS
jgi:rhamnosyltransferase